MEQLLSNPVESFAMRKERIGLGIIGAFLFSLAGAVLYVALYQFGFIAGLSGLVAVTASYFGYGLFSGKKVSKMGLICSIVFAVLSMLIAEYICLVIDAYDILKEGFSDTPYTPTLHEAIRGLHYLLKDYSVVDFAANGDGLVLVWEDCGESYGLLTAALKDIGLSLLFCTMAAFGFVRQHVQTIKAEKAHKQAEKARNPAEF